MNAKQLKDRMRWARAQKGWSAADLIRESKVPQGTVSKIESGNQESLGKYGLALQRALGVRMEWLASNTGNPFSQDTCTISNSTNANIMADALADHVYVKSYELSIGAIDKEFRYMTVSRTFLERNNINVSSVVSIVMSDDSFSDRILQGDQVAINTAFSQLQHNSVYAIEIAGQHTLRRVLYQANGSLVLKSRNPDFLDDIVAEADIDKLKVLGEFVNFQGQSA